MLSKILKKLAVYFQKDRKTCKIGCYRNHFSIFLCYPQITSQIHAYDATQRVAKTVSMSSSLRKPTLKAVIFRCFDVFLVWSSQKFQVQAKISTTQTVFPDCFSISYDYVGCKYVGNLEKTDGTAVFFQTWSF